MPPTPFYSDSAVTIYHADCRNVLPHLSTVDLLLTDPPYGIGADAAAHKASGHIVGHGHRRVAKRTYPETSWDVRPEMSLLWRFVENSSRAAIWGGNYFALPGESGWLVWDKENDGNGFADCELAWTNFGGAVRIKRHLWNGMARKFSEPRWEHPTQKPLEVMKWAITKCPVEARTILDPFMGSGTTLRAAKDLGRKAIGIEIEEKYCEIAAKRMAQETISFPIANLKLAEARVASQGNLFDSPRELQTTQTQQRHSAGGEDEEGQRSTDR